MDLIAEYQQYETAGVDDEGDEVYEGEYQEEGVEGDGQVYADDSVQYADQ